MKFVFKRMNKKGFSLIELIVVIAILAIIAAVAIPRFAGIQERSEIKADATTADEIINAARIQHTDTGTALTDAAGDAAEDVIGTDYMTVPTTCQSGAGGFTLTYNATTLVYSVSFTPTGYNAVVVTENDKFDYATDVTKP